MKKIFFMVMLITGITKPEYACAQTNANQVFDLPEERFGRQFTVELDRGNRLQVSVTDINDLSYLKNMDSILNVFTAELASLKDSVAASTAPKRIDYNMDAPSAKKIRVRKTVFTESYYAIIKGSPARLKMMQDTIVISGKIPAASAASSRRRSADHYFCIIFYLNNINDLAGYRDARLNDKIRIIQEHYKDKWVYRQDERMQLVDHPEITSNTAKGYLIRTMSFIIKKSVEVQNYKDHFIPSISCTPTYVKESEFIRREFGLTIEAAFGFEHTDSNTSKTRINVLGGISYNVLPIIEQRQRAKIYPSVQLFYLIHRSGTLYDKSSFRFALATYRFNNFSTMIQPAIYFSNFLKHVTPSLRIIQRF